MISHKILSRSDLFGEGVTAPPKQSAQTKQVLTVMVENSGQVRSLLEDIIKRLDGQAALGEKRYEEQQSFNSGLSKEIQGVQKQLDLTQKEVDETRQEAASATTAATNLGTDLRPAAANGVVTTLLPPARLTNESAPLMPEPSAA